MYIHAYSYIAYINRCQATFVFFFFFCSFAIVNTLYRKMFVIYGHTAYTLQKQQFLFSQDEQSSGRLLDCCAIDRKCN